MSVYCSRSRSQTGTTLDVYCNVLFVAIRPLRVEELAEVLAVDFDDSEGVPKLNPSWHWEDEEQALLSSCSSLIVTVDADSQRVVQFSHFSVKEFLTSARLATSTGHASRYHIMLEPAHTTLAQASLSALLRTGNPIKGLFYSLLARYAAEHWVSHHQFKNVSSHLRKAMEFLFDPDKPHFAAWLQWHHIDTVPCRCTFYKLVPYPKSNAAPLYYARLWGFQDVVEHLIVKYPQHVNARDGHYMSPAVAALARRHFQVANLLHLRGSSVNFQGNAGASPLHFASHTGDLEMVGKLLEY